MVQVSYPGVYIQEIPSGVHTITGVATSITAFVGRAPRGDVNDPVDIGSFGDYVRDFGGLSLDSSMSYAVQQFFQNGGSEALIVRVYHQGATDGIAALPMNGGGIAAQGTLTIATNPVDGDTMKIDNKTYIFDDTVAVAAQGKLTLAANPANNETMTIGAKTYTFQTVLTDVDGNIAIGANLVATQANVVAAINLSGVGGTNYAASMTAHPTVAAGTFAANDLILTAKTAGTAGNSIATTSTFAAAGSHFDAATLGTTRAGSDAGVINADGRIAIGANVAATQANIVAAINRTGLAGTQYATAMTVHTTVAAASAFAGNNLVLTAKTVGIAGNSIVTTETFAGATNVFDAGTLGTTRAGAPSGTAAPKLVAANPGKWGSNLRAYVDFLTRDPTDTNLFNLEIREIDPTLAPTAPPVRSEKYLNLSVSNTSPQFIDKVLESRSDLVRVATTSTTRPDPIDAAPFTGGDDGQPIDDNDISDPNLEGAKQGLWALEKADLFNLLCIPPLTLEDGGDIGGQTRSAADAYCTRRRAMFLVDPLSDWDKPADAIAPTGVDGSVFGLARSPNSALFFPRIISPDPLRDGQLEPFAPCGAMAGIMARTDASRGVWKAPAGIEATLSGVSDLTVNMTDHENGLLNPLGVNCLRSFPVIGRVSWGARTLEGADQLASEWKYIPIRRLALMMEESLFRGTKWVVFEPNDEPLWANIRLNVGAYMMSLFRQGAFQGTSPKDAFFVKCDAETTTQNDRNNGIVNIVVGFAPLKPAEFVVISIQQIAGQL